MQAPPFWHARRATTALLVGVIAAIVALTALAVGASAALVALTPAVAAVPAAGITITPEGYGNVHLGPIEGPVGSQEHGYCLQARVTASGPGDVPVAVAHVDDGPLAAAFARHRHDTDDLTQAALGYAAHQRHERPGSMAGGVVGSVKALVAAATPQAVTDRAAQLIAEGAAEAGPYTAEAGTVTGAGTRTGAISGIALRTASGGYRADVPVTVTLQGPAVLDATGTHTYSGMTGTQPLSLTWTATGNGEVTYRVQFDDAWRTTLTVFDMAGSRQDQLTYGNRPGHDPEEIAEPGPPFGVVVDFRPRAGTTVQDVRVQDGDPLVDQVEFAAAPGDEWVVLDGDPVDVPADVTWYGPFAQPQPQSATPPPDAPRAGVERIVADGPGPVTTPGTVRATGDGFYTAVVTIRQADAGPSAEYIREDFTAPYFEEVETAVNRYDLAHESQTREFNVAPGGRAFDRITVTGYPADHGTFAGLGRWQPDLGAATVTVHGPLPALPATADVPAGTPVFWTDTVRAVDGVYDIGYDEAHPVVAPTMATHPGGDYYVFVYAFAGDDRVEPFVSPFDDLREVFFVPGNPEVVVPPAVVTQAQESAELGEPIHDLALVTGTIEDGDHLVFRAYGPQDPAAAPVCDESTLRWTSDPVAVTGDGYYDSGPTTVDRTGAVYWVETLHGGDGSMKDVGECGIASETTRVRDEPSVRTTALASTEDPVVGDQIWDVVTVTGEPPEGATTVVDLFHADEGEELTCTEPIWTSGAIALDGAGEYGTARYPTTKPGTFGFVERTVRADGTEISTGACGEPSETLTVVAVPEPDGPTPEEPAPEGPVPAEPGLAVTGADVALMLVLAGTLLAAGVAVVAYRARVRRALDEAEGVGSWPGT